ncbi:FecR family protein [uncultured Parabacteroides sp.]|uniref:FecR family protein n=1 Tax=uncultured Parabacteroides sp. TaxID=512312 RepID=UPI00259BC36F|nr:FecR family protein [uncultured Parabacteroides sp.]
METFNIDQIEELLPRYCSGEATVEECRMVEEWIGKSEDNYRIVKQIYAIDQVMGTAQMESKVDTEKALASVCGRMILKSKINMFILLQRVAAILFIPLLIVWSIEHFIPSHTEIAQLIEIKTNPGMTTTVNLPDGSIVYLNSESSLTYPSFFSEGKRSVQLKGEAFFEIQKDPEHGFIVSTPNHTQIEVLGTSFNVEAFEKDSFISTTLVEGKVRFAYQKNHYPTTIVMKPGQKLVYNTISSQVKLLKTNGETETAWKDGKIVFQATPLPEALRMLEKRFNVDFILSNNRLHNEAFNGTFTNQRLERILEIFKISSNIKWRYLDTRDTTNERTRIELY